MDTINPVTFRVFDVRRNAVTVLHKVSSTAEWKIAPPVDHGRRGGTVEILVVDPDPGHAVQVLCAVFDPESATGTDSVVVNISTDAPKGQHPFEVYVDGQYVNANSAPGIIVD